MREARPSAAISETVLGHEGDRVTDFQEVLKAVEGVHVVDVPMDLSEPEPIHDAASYFLNVVRTPGTHMYLDPQLTGGEDKAAPRFEALKAREKHSAHGLFFGKLVFDDGDVVPVAVKPHEIDTEQSCATDYFSNIAARELNAHTLQPAGMILSKDRAYSMTVIQQLSTLDSIDWREVIAREGYDGEMMNVWSQAARQAAMLHASGSTAHGDLAPRNIAMKEDGGVFFIDWERAQISTAQPRDAEGRYRFSRQDMGELMESLVRSVDDKFKAGIGVLEDHEDRWEGFRQLVFNEYIETRLGFAAEQGITHEVEDELRELEYSLKAHYELIRS